MPNEAPPSLPDAMAEAVAKAKDAAASSDGSQGGTEGEGQSKERELSAREQQLVAGAEEEFAALTPEGQALYLKLADKQERSFSKKMSEVDNLKKLGDALTLQYPDITSDELFTAMTAHRTARTDGKKPEMLTGFDAYMDKAKTAEDREAMRELKQRTQEEMQRLLTDHAKPLQEKIANLERLVQSVSVRDVEAELRDLEKEYPISFLDKYRDEVRKWASNPAYRSQSAEDLLIRIAGKEVKEVFQRTAKPKPKTSSPAGGGGGVTTPTLPDQELSTFKQKRGGWDLSGMVRHLAQRKAPA